MVETAQAVRVIGLRSPRWKYQGVWDVQFSPETGWGKRRAVIAYYPERKGYHIAIVGINLAPEWMSDKEIGRWLRMHEGRRIHR